ncbi:alpha/beta hydrolase [Alkalilimnicola ehrlichii]|uniref:alpha/beta hydrolase n=1 Tax=Alkalilimnicola ehrlichii TaxID=351052 RepID=UPI001C6E3461|nr:alpha/beta hydrolase [Alkalilimnicola ehrlichii]
MASVPPTGLCGSALRMLATDPYMLVRMSFLHGGGGFPDDFKMTRRAVFSEDVPEEEVQRYASRFQAESHRALWDMTVANLPQQWRIKPPRMLVLGAEDDILFSPAMVETTARAYQAEMEMFPRMAHGMMLETNWQAVADRILRWLQA